MYEVNTKYKSLYFNACMSKYYNHLKTLSDEQPIINRIKNGFILFLRLAVLIIIKIADNKSVVTCHDEAFPDRYLSSSEPMNVL